MHRPFVGHDPVGHREAAEEDPGGSTCCPQRELTDPATGKTYFDDRLYVISADYLYVFDCTYGQKIWSYHLGINGDDGFQPASGPYAIGTEGSLRIYIGDWEGRIRVVTRHPTKLLPYLDWQWNLRAVPTARPEGYDMLAYVADRQGKLSCFDLERELLWQQDCGAPLHGAPFLRGRNAYVGSEDSVFHVFNRLSGMPQGKLFMGQPITRQPFAFTTEPTSVYLWTDDQHGLRGGLSRIATVDDNIAYEDVEQFDLQVNRLSKAMDHRWCQACGCYHPRSHLPDRRKLLQCGRLRP